MLKKLTTTFAVLVLFTMVVNAQWNNLGIWPQPDPDTLKGSTHALAVDPDGKVWVSNYYSSGTLETDTTVSTRAIYIFNPDGTQADFSPIRLITVDGVEDTLLGASFGMTTDPDGNILYANGGAAGSRIYRINYETGEGMAKGELNFGIENNSATKPAVAANGNVFITTVFPGPVYELNPDLTFLTTAVDAKPSYSRTLEVSEDGNTIYLPEYPRLLVTVYERANAFAEFDSVGIMFEGMAVESMDWHPTTGNFWVSAGSGTNPSNPPYSDYTWYAYDFDNEMIVDSLKWTLIDGIDPANQRPRAIDFSPDGDIAYIATFGVNALPMMQKLEKVVSVEQIDGVVVEDYALEQNYPNPFNPSTTISFSIPEAGMVTLKVYDMLGQEVATLVNEELAQGQFTVNFDASRISSGTYIYQLQTQGATIAKKMMLLK